MSQEEAESALMQRENQDKTFLVRESITVQNALVVSTVDSDRIKKYLVQRNSSGGYTIPEPRGGIFPSLDKFIEVLRQNNHITVPCQRDDWECGEHLSTYREEPIATGRRSVFFQGHWTPDVRRRWAATKSAVRELNETSQRSVEDIEELLACAKLLKTLSHPRIVKLLGVRTTGTHLCIATEFMERGDLLKYLHNEGSSLSTTPLLSIARQITKGMRYLSEDMLTVHRKLKASNVLIGACPAADVRITGFSSARFIPPGSKFVKGDENEKLPIKWLAPESLNKSEYYVKSDVWSFGVVVSELVTHGKKPYREMNNEQVMQFVCGTWRMPKPENCPEDVYSLMNKCWARSRDSRPSFLFLEGHLEELGMKSM